MNVIMQSRLFQEATDFISQCYSELGKSNEEVKHRLSEIKKQIEAGNHYDHTFEELQHGARMAWRNSTRCIGRLFWDSLQVFDRRNCETEDEVAEALFQHIKYATNNGKIIPTITVLKPAIRNEEQFRIWNYQLIRYAGYETDQGVIGDSSSIELTKECEKMGWKGEGTHFDLLPIVIQRQGEQPKWYEIPREIVVEVPLRHPEIPAFADLHLKWYGLPVVSELKLEIGGIHYTAAPFNGWYMGTEIGARNFADHYRYNMLPKVAEMMGLDTSREATLWRDKALVELNVAVLYSFKEDGVSIVDHHTAAAQFKRFEEREAKQAREVTGNWTWLIPPLSPATTHVFHKPYKNKTNKPNYFYQKKPYN